MNAKDFHPDTILNRRTVLRAVVGVSTGWSFFAFSKPKIPLPSLSGEIGITTGSFGRHFSESREAGKIRLLDLPRLLREELDMRPIDLMTANLPSMEPDYLEQLRTQAELAGCVLSNLKMNQKGLDMASAEESERRRALDEYKRSIDAAASLGVRWVRPLPGPTRPDPELYAASYRELIDYAAPRGVTLLIENFGWIQGDPDAIPEVIERVGSGLAAQPDTGNWDNDEVRYTGLARAFPLAVSCDFKARTLRPDGEHEAYDLERCFEIGWDAGFRGPWCFEHTHRDLPTLLKNLGYLRDQLRRWISARG